ncbi:MAG: sulfotransferase domain-containing protein [Thermodesulfobacteriota bacterium]|nr:sulfotransferase domain-containing protein [Thermodesulfobacteriota bacterium]
MPPSVFANGIGKSGTNLLIKLCGLLGAPYSGFGLAASSIIGPYKPVRKLLRAPKPLERPVDVGLEVSAPVSPFWLRQRLGRCRGKCVSGHAAHSKRLVRMLLKNRYKIIQIVRDPRDVAVSFAHWIHTRPDYYAHPAFAGLSRPESMLALINGRQCGRLKIKPLAEVLDRSLGWLSQGEGMLVLRFEDLVGERGQGSAKAQQKALTLAAEFLHGRGSADLPDLDMELLRNSLFGGTKTFRTGTIGTWKKEFTRPVKAAFEKQVGHRLSLWGYA